MPDHLPTWSGTPLDDRNLGSHLDIDTVICLVGDPGDMKGNALIAQTEIERVEIGQSVRILVDELHEQILTGTIAEIARVAAEQRPPELIAKQLLADESSSSANAHYAVSIALDGGQPTPLLWSSGQAKIAVRPLTLAEAIYNHLCHTFRIDL